MYRNFDRFVPWGGLIAAAGGLIWIAGLVLVGSDPFSVTRSYTPLMIVGLLLMGVGMLTGHLRQIRRTGLMGQFALVVTALSLIFLAFTRIAVDRRTIDLDSIYFGMAFIFVLASFFVFGMLGMWAGVLSRPAVAVMLLGLAAIPFMNLRAGLIWPGVAFGVAWIWLGLDMLIGRRVGQETVLPSEG